MSNNSQQTEADASVRSTAWFSRDLSPDCGNSPRTKRIRKELKRGEFDPIALKVENERLRARLCQMKHIEAGMNRAVDEVVRINGIYGLALHALQQIAGRNCSSPAECACNALAKITQVNESNAS